MMKNFRTTLVTLVIGALLGGYIYFFERGPVKKKDEEEKKAKIFEGFVADDVAEIKLENLGTTVTAEKDPIEIKKDDKGIWQIVAPKKLRADESMVRTLLGNVGDFNPETSIDNPANLADFGLNSPNARSTFKTKAGVSFQLLIGDKNAPGTSDYVKSAGKNTVFLIPTSSIDPFKRPLNNFRDHTFMKTDMVLAKKVRVTHGADQFEFEKDKDNIWRITAPLQDRVEEGKIRDLLNSLNSLRADDFVKEGAGSLASYGLSKPQAKYEVWPADGGPVKTLLIGKKRDKALGNYAKSGDNPAVCLIGDYPAKMADIKINDYRDKSVMRFDAGAVKTITVTHNGTTTLYTKDDKGLWSSPGRTTAQDEANSIVPQLSQMTILGFAAKGAKTGLASSSLSVDVALLDGTTRHYRFGNREKDQVYLASDKTKDVYLISSGVVSQLEGYFSTILTPVPTLAAAPAAKK